MKTKLTLLLFSLFCAIGAWADVTDLPTLTTNENSPKLYVIKNTRSNKYIAYRSDSEKLRQIDDISSAAIWYFTEGTGTTNENQVSVRMKSYFADGKAINSVNLNAFNNTGVNVAIVKRPGADGVYLDMYDNAYNYADGYNTAINDGAKVSLTLWGAKDDGSVFVITPIDDILDDLKTKYSALVDGCETLTALFSSSNCTTAKTAITNSTTGLGVISAYETLLATANGKCVTLKSYTGQKYIVLGENITASDSDGSVMKVVCKKDLLAFQNLENGFYVGLSPTDESKQFTSSTTPEYFQMKFDGSYSGYACFASSNARTTYGPLTMHQSYSSIVTWYSNEANSYFLPALISLDDCKQAIKEKLDAISGWQPIYAAADITTAKSNVDAAATADAISTIYENAIKAANGKLLYIKNYQNADKYLCLSTSSLINTYPTVIKLLVNDDLTYSLQGYLNYASYYVEELTSAYYTAITSSTTAGKYRIGHNDTKGFIFYSTQHDGCMHYSGGNIVRWYDDENASHWTVTEANDAAYLGSYYNALLPYQANYGEYGYYKSGSMSKSYFDENIINTCASVLADLTTYSAYIKSMKDAAISAYNNMTAAVPVAGDFLRIKASDANKTAWSLGESNLYLTSSNCPNKTDRAGFAKGDATDNTTIFYYDGTYLTGYANGLQPKKNGSNMLLIGSAGEAATTISFQALYNVENTSYGITFATNRALYTGRGGTEGSYYYHTDAAGSGNTGEHYRYFLEKVTSLPITMNKVDDAYYATINLPVAVTIPSGLSAYSATAAGDVLTLTKVVEDGVLAANTPVILYSESSVTSLDIASTAGTAAVSNELEGTTAAISVTANQNYVLNCVDGQVGFYLFNGTAMPGFKAYLPSSATSNVKAFTFSFEDAEDAIRAIESENSGLEIYDISGRRVQKAQKGLYIVNGKKVMYK